MQAFPAAFAAIFGGGAAAAAGGAAAAGATATAATATAATFAKISTGIKIASAVAGLASSVQMSKYQSRVAENNATIAENNALDASQQAQEEAEQRGRFAQVEMGELLANQAASGLNLGSGSYALSRKSQAQLAARDTSLIIQQGADRAENFRQQGADFRSEADQADRAGRFAFLEAGINIGSSAISGAAKVSKIRSRRLVV
jgi:hypothetical protein